MKISLRIPAYCECGWPMVYEGALRQETMSCVNRNCGQFGRKFKAPSIEVHEA